MAFMLGLMLQACYVSRVQRQTSIHLWRGSTHHKVSLHNHIKGMYQEGRVFSLLQIYPALTRGPTSSPPSTLRLGLLEEAPESPLHLLPNSILGWRGRRGAHPNRAGESRDHGEHRASDGHLGGVAARGAVVWDARRRHGRNLSLVTVRGVLTSYDAGSSSEIEIADAIINVEHRRGRPPMFKDAWQRKSASRYVGGSQLWKRQGQRAT